MKRYLLAALSVLFFVSLGFSQKVRIDLGKTQGYQVLSQSGYGFELNLQIGQVLAQKTESPAGEFFKLQAPELIKVLGNGEPMLPAFSRLIRVPFGAEVSVQVVSADYKIVNLKEYGINKPLMPAQPSVRKSEDPNRHFMFNKVAYTKNAFQSSGLVKYEDLGIMRNIRYGRLQITPFEYNPVTNELKVYTDIRVKVTFKHPDLALTTKMDRLYNIPGRVDNSIFLNTLPSLKSVGIPTNFPLTYVVVAPAAFKNNAKLVEFINWKKQQGYLVIEGYTGDNVGTTADNIKTWLQDLYNNPPAGYNPPAYVVFIGDVSNMPSHQYSEITDSPYSDLYMVDFTGDYRPEIDFGRISAESTTELENALTKILHFERDQFAGDYSHLHEVLMVPGDDESHEDTWGNGQIWYGVNYYFNAAHNIYSHTFYQDPENNGVPGGNAAVHDSILADISNGISFANYTAHCSADGWAEPSFSISDLSTLTNQDKYSVWIGNCCQSFKFDESDAFGEVALYIADKGAAAYIGGSQYTYWDEDYWWGVGVGEVVAQPQYDQTGRGVYDAMFHDRTNEVNDPSVWALSVRQQIDAGNLAVDASTSDMKNYYWCIYQVSGDPSMISRVGTPQVLTVNLDPMVVGSTQITGTALPYAFVAVTQDNNLIGAGMADANGNITINTVQPIPGGMLHVVGYGQNMTVYIEDVPAYVPNDPYLLVTGINPDTVSFNSSVTFDLTIGNINDSLGADSVYVLISTADTTVTVTNDSLWIGAFAAGDTVTFNGVFTAQFGIVKDKYPVTFNFEIYGVRDSSYLWESKKTVLVRAPSLSITDMHFADPQQNGFIDVGTTDTLLVTIHNSGGADADNVVVSLTTSNSELTNPAPVTVSVPAGSDVVVGLPVQVPSTATEGIKTTFYVNAVQDIYATDDSVLAWVGQPAELVIGTGTEEVRYPLYDYYENERTQILYKAEDLAGAHMIQAIGFHIVDGNAWNFNNFKILIKPTDLTELSDFVDMSDAVVVYEEDVFEYPGGITNDYYMINLQQPYFYNGLDNLLVEVIWGDNGQYSSYDASIHCYGTNMNYNSVAYGLADSETPPSLDGVSSTIPNTKFEFTAFGATFVIVPDIYRDTVLHETDVPVKLVVRNYGSDTATNQTIVLRTDDPGLTILDSVETIAAIPPNSAVTVDNAFTVHIGALEDGHVAKITFVTDNASQVGYLVVKAPEIEFVDAGLVDNQVYLPGGQSSQYFITLTNTGQDIAPSVTLSMTANQSDIFAIGNAPDPVDLAPGDTVTLYFPVSAADIDSTAKIKLDIQAVSGSYTFETQEITWINLPYEQIIGEPEYYTDYYPFYQYFENEKTQMLFYPDEFISLPVEINKFGVNVYNIEGNLIPLKNLTIRIFTTTDTTATDDYFTESTTPVTVYSSSADYVPELGWNIFVFNKSTFSYDGNANLVVELVWGDNGEYDSDNIDVLLTYTDNATVAYGYSDVETPPVFDNASHYRPIAFFSYGSLLSSVDEQLSYAGIFPNPTSGQFTISNASGATMTVMDIYGRTIMSKKIVSDAQTFDISGYTSGLYLIRLDSDKGTVVLKLIKR